MPQRVFRSVAKKNNVRLTDILGSLFALELLSPSQYFYVISPFLSEVSLLDNRYGQYRALLFEQTETWVGLAALLNALAAREVTVRVMYQPDARPFVKTLSDAVEKQERSTLHEKGLVSDHFWLSGSMNYTYSGVNQNDEQISLVTDKAQVAQAMLDVHERWGRV